MDQQPPCTRTSTDDNVFALAGRGSAGSCLEASHRHLMSLVLRVADLLAREGLPSDAWDLVALQVFRVREILQQQGGET